jgi:ribosomal protein S8
MNITIINFLIQIKNASLFNKNKISSKFSKLRYLLIKLLYNKGLIQSFYVENNFIIIFIRYINNKSLLKDLKIFSKPSHKIFLKFSDICKIKEQKIIFFLFTNQFLILTNTECKKKHLGGKLLFAC